MRKFFVFLAGVLVGAWTGSMLSLLFAPESGSEMQIRIREGVNRLVEEGKAAAIADVTNWRSNSSPSNKDARSPCRRLSSLQKPASARPEATASPVHKRTAGLVPPFVFISSATYAEAATKASKSGSIASETLSIASGCHRTPTQNG